VTIFLTGATGYIGKRLLPVLLQAGHRVVCCVRDRQRFRVPAQFREQIRVCEVDFSRPVSVPPDVEQIDVAFFLIHSMSAAIRRFEGLEAVTARNFVGCMNRAGAGQIVFLSGISGEGHLSAHMRSRRNVEKILRQADAPVTVLRAGIVVGSGSASFEIIRDLVEKLPVMVAPRWLRSLCQPIAVRDVISCLTGVMRNPECLNRTFDIGGTDILTYKQMLLEYARIRGLKRLIFTLPVMTPHLSSYWLYFITSTSYKLAANLVDSMKSDAVCRDCRLQRILKQSPLGYSQAIEAAFQVIKQNAVISSWKDALVSSSSLDQLAEYARVPTHGCLSNEQSIRLDPDRVERVRDNIWSIGGDQGWYFANRIWAIRGFVDRIFGGVGLRRGRTRPDTLHAGDALDFWRVVVADWDAGRLMLYAEMKLPGEAWLEFDIRRETEGVTMVQTATFRPHGVLGRLYWYLLWPVHVFIFHCMARRIAAFGGDEETF